MTQPRVHFLRRRVLIVMMVFLVGVSAEADNLDPGVVVTVDFRETELPPSLFSMMTGEAAPPTLSYRLPDNYDPEQRYPLLVYVPGYHGGPNGNIGNAQAIAGNTDWVVASLRLFTSSLNRDEIGGGILVGFSDYPTVSRAYEVMLGKLFELVPNIDPERSAMVGFSNGALTIAVLVSNHDEFVLSHFKAFCLVDHGMFHLSDLYKERTRDCRFLILSGDDERDMGRELKIRGGRLSQDAWGMLGVDLTFFVMKDTGHEFRTPQMELVGRWLRHQPLEEDTTTPPRL